jgi:peptidoglycan/LPS O-acetylase OafA/YrhL
VSFESSAAVVDHEVVTHPAWVRLNNVTELRLLFAASVVLSHAAALIDPDGFRLFRVILNSEAAVQGFFILSGYLVCGSYDRIHDPLLFYKRRFLRIYPAYFVAVMLFITLGIGEALLLGTGLSWNQVPRYLFANLTTLNFLQPGIDGVFARNPIQVVNGALWSIKVEIMFYALLPLIYLIGRRLSFVRLGLALILAGALWWPALNWLAAYYGVGVPTSFKFQLPGQLHFFGLGIILFARSKGQVSTGTTAAIVISALVLLVGLGEWRAAVEVLALITIIGGVSSLPQIKGLLPGQDISYGIYLCHFPLIQLLVAAGFGQLPFLLYLAIVVVLTISYGMFSWRWIERPALDWGGR